MSANGGATRQRRVIKWLAIAMLVIVGVIVLTGALLAPLRPSNDRHWVPEHERLPHAIFDGRRVRVENVRNFHHVAPGRFQPAYDDRIYDLDRLESVWFVLTPFGKRWRGPAHSFVSFGFRGDSTAAGVTPPEFVSISVEARRERGETYGAFAGLWRRFELLYVVGDERDLIGLRAVINRDVTEVYPVTASPEHIRQMFVAMLERANALRERPEFYNTATSNCTSNLVEHVNAIAPRTIPHGIKTILPGYADEVARAVGFIDRTLSVSEARQRYRVNDRAKAAWGHSDFSLAIRR
jgi:hypothetical protein